MSSQGTDSTMRQATDLGPGSERDDGNADTGSDSTIGGPTSEPIEKIAVPNVPKGGDNSLVTFGDEADDAETAEVVAGLMGYLDARANGAWEQACSFLAVGLTDQIAQLQAQQEGGEELDCPEILKGLSASVSKDLLKSAAKVQVGSVRVNGERAFVIYKGDHNHWYVASMNEEDGVWKSGTLAPSELP